jgi:D-3-phosphoglycerate dehydrogenase / 2-oxoglutarate reductase
MSELEFVIVEGAFPGIDVETEHLVGRGATIRSAPLGSVEEVARACADADGVIVSTEPLPREFIEVFGPRVKIIGRAGIGLDAIDMEEASRRGIAVFHTPDYATEEVATHAVALILADNRKLIAGDALARSNWDAWDSLGSVAPLSEQTVGIIGLGRIGSAVAQLLVPFRPELLGFDPVATSAPVELERVSSLEEILGRSDIITLHAPLSAETRGLIGATQLAQMRPGALLVNVSRGGLIDEEALCAALEAGRVRAALDVLVTEPPDPDKGIVHAPNAILSPHFAWYSVSSELRVRTDTLDGLLDYLAGRPISVGRLAVDPSRG